MAAPSAQYRRLQDQPERNKEDLDDDISGHHFGSKRTIDRWNMLTQADRHKLTLALQTAEHCSRDRGIATAAKDSRSA